MIGISWTGMPDGSLSAADAEQLSQLLGRLDDRQRRWLTVALMEPPDAEAAAVSRTALVTVLYGSQSGHAEALAHSMAARLEAGGAAVAVTGMEEMDPRRLAGAGTVLFFISTQGDGDPPDNALAFCRFLDSDRAGSLSTLSYAVLALGDRTYDHFCAVGLRLDQRLRDLGARRLYPVATLDVDYQEEADAWMDAVLRVVAREGPSQSQRPAPALTRGHMEARNAPRPGRDRRSPVSAEVLENLLLNGRGSDKVTHHVELRWDRAWAPVVPGDSLGVVPKNRPQDVETLLEALGWHGDEPWIGAGVPQTVADALTEGVEIGRLRRQTVEALAQLSRRSAGHEPQGLDLESAVLSLGLRGAAPNDILPLLDPLKPRLYSVASSLRWVPDEVHLTVALARFARGTGEGRGVASDYLCRTPVGDRVAVFVEPNTRFRLPPDPRAPVIMIGPGTGVAPFRAFLQEREALGADGRHWLFFGDRRFRTDFLYQTEWQAWRHRGLLERLDVAFSRDQDRKIYVQHQLAERGKEVFRWLQEGAYVYVCGEADGMARDVDRTLRHIIRHAGGLSDDRRDGYMDALIRDRRYQRDVY